LYDFQREAVDKLVDQPAVIIGDDMGLGKTVQTIALLLALKQEKKTEALRVLIVAPTSVVTNWVREIERFAPTLTVALWHGQQRKEQADELETADVIITSYALLRRDEEMLKELFEQYGTIAAVEIEWVEPVVGEKAWKVIL